MEKIIILKLKPEQVNIIGSALMEMPTKYGAPLIQEINKQINEQKISNENKTTGANIDE